MAAHIVVPSFCGPLAGRTHRFRATPGHRREARRNEYMYIQMRVYIHVCMYLCMYVCMYVCIYTHTCMYMYMVVSGT